MSKGFKDTAAGRFGLTLSMTWHYLVILLAAAVVAYYYVHPALVAVPALMGLFVLYFFRNPKRNIPEDTSLILSPADGVILDIEEVFEDKYIQDMAIRVNIFLSIMDVHLNRSPLRGEVGFRLYRPGKFIPAFKSHACEINEKNYIGIDSDGYRILVCQVTGFIARRIKCWAEKGRLLARGEIFGIIKFGSGTELFIPSGSTILVKKGDKVRAGETVIGTLPVKTD